MARSPRKWIPGAGAHTISRFVDRRFRLVDDVDRQALLDAICRANARWDWVWLSYAAMSSHVHYAHIAGQVDPDRFSRSAHTRFAQRYHHRAGRDTLGPVFADRPSIYPVRACALTRLVAYHHRNPVEAGVVERPSHSTWTSHRAYLRLDPAPPWLDVERAFDLLGFSDTAAGRRHFDEFVMEVDLSVRPWEPQPEAPLEFATLNGSPEIDWARLEKCARAVTELPEHEPLHSKRRCVVKTRLLIALIATRDFGQSYGRVAAQLGMTPGSVSNLVARKGADGDLEGLLAEIRRRLLWGNDEMMRSVPVPE